MLKDGQCFGEQALINHKPRAATIKCKTDCYLGTLYRVDYENSVGKIQRTQIEKLISFLKNIPYFANWSKTAVSKLFYYLKKEKFNKN